MKIEWKGVYPALTTKLTSTEQLDLSAFDNGVKEQVLAGVDGIILAGSLGEASVLSEDEKQILLKHTVAHWGTQVPVIYGISESTTTSAVQCAVNAEKNGASGLMLLPPMRYKSDTRETLQFFKEVVTSVSLPVMVYNNPVDYKIEITIEMFETLAKYDNVQSVKESTRDITNVTRMINHFGDRFSILCGVDTLALESMAAGSNGWVAGLVNAFPKETVAIYRLVKAGRMQEALAIYRWFMPLLELDIHPKLVQYIKLAETYAGLGTEWVRAPRLILEGEERERISKIITDGIATRPSLPDYLSIKL